jgi:hypothetical protein
MISSVPSPSPRIGPPIGANCGGGQQNCGEGERGVNPYSWPEGSLDLPKSGRQQGYRTHVRNHRSRSSFSMYIGR